VKLEHAIEHAQAMVPGLKGKDAVAVHVLVEIAKRAKRLRKPVRQLADALSPRESELNQESLFPDEDDAVS